ncbi:MAG TPA: BadF/BadG/BcrA/BcrD ATPase family protein [Candidatus Acidoferrales bacterium]|nr:BadF/BadG/BcrA/BcrD ATPase family protein [Candidatus Acidoferrales bacterium]
MHQKKSGDGATYILGFDGGGTKTECLLADEEGNVLARATTGPSNPLRAGYMKAWFALGEAADSVMARQKITADRIAGVCAGLGGAGRPGVVRRVRTYFERSFPHAEIRVTTDLEIALEAAFGGGEGILLLAGTGSAAFGRDANGRTARAGGRGPWFSDEGSAFDIGREAVRAVSLADEHRGPETALTKKIISPHQWRDWTILLEAVSKNADDVFPKIFPFVAQLADKNDAVSQRILTQAAGSLAGLALAVANELGWSERAFDVAKWGGVYGHSKFFDAAIETEAGKLMPQARFIGIDVSPAEAAVRMAVREVRAKGNAA